MAAENTPAAIGDTTAPNAVGIAILAICGVIIALMMMNEKIDLIYRKVVLSEEIPVKTRFVVDRAGRAEKT